MHARAAVRDEDNVSDCESLRAHIFEETKKKKVSAVKMLLSFL